MTYNQLKDQSEDFVKSALDAVKLEDWTKVKSKALSALALDRRSILALRLWEAAEFRLAEGNGVLDVENTALIATDEQTGKRYWTHPESRFAAIVAGISACYLISWLVVISFLTLDTWSGRNAIVQLLGFDQATLTTDTYKLLATTAIAGALGATIDGLRALISWHAERQAYGPGFFWRDLALPLIGGAVGVLAYLVVRGGAGVVSGDFSLDKVGGVPVITAVGLATLAGFSSRQVFKWLDGQANNIFKVQPSSPPETSHSSAEAAQAVETV